MQTIDLHGVKHKDVPKVIINCCATWDTPFIAITGNSVSMKRIVRDTAQQFGLKVRDSVNNPGRVVVG